MKDLPLSLVMNQKLLTAAPDESLSVAMTRMSLHDVHHLLVMDQGRMVGILSSADELKLALLRRTPPSCEERPASESLGLKVRDVMQTHVAVIRENSSMRDAARALSLGGFHALPVLAIDGTPIGIVTSTDLICLLLDQIERAEPASAPRPLPAETREPTTPFLLEALR